MSNTDMIAIIGIGSTLLVFLIGQLTVSVWWASKITQKLADLEEIIKSMQLNSKESFSTIWQKHDELKCRVEKIEKSCLINHSHRREDDAS